MFFFCNAARRDTLPGMLGQIPHVIQSDRLALAGARFGARGTHTSRTMMLEELTETLRCVPATAVRADYEAAIVSENALGKATDSNRRLTLQRLSELYGLDPRLPLFAVLRRVWELDADGRPLTALLCALARDPLFRSTAPYVLGLPQGAELTHAAYLDSIRTHVEARLNDSILDKVRRNSSSSWTQSGHFKGRVRKVRASVNASFGPVALALWLGSLEGLVADDLLGSFWMRIFDSPRHVVIDAVLRCKQAGLVYASIGGGVVQIDPAPVFKPLAVEAG
jgi:hypothetical protein